MSDTNGPCSKSVMPAALPSNKATTTFESETDVQQERREDLLRKVITNPIVGSVIASYLSFEDLKAASQVSKGFYEMIRDTMQFNKNTMLCIRKGSLGASWYDSCILKTTYAWKNIQLDLSIPINIGIKINKIQHILENTESMQILATGKFRYRRMTGKTLTNRFVATLSSSPKLKRLEIESGLLDKLMTFGLTNAQLQQAFLRLQSLKIYDSYWYHANPRGRIVQNILQISMITGMRLECFRVMFHENDDRVEYISRIIAANANTLKELDLTFKFWNWECEELKHVKCPHLKSLSIDAEEAENDIIVAFAKNQPDLEELAIQLDFAFPIELLQTIGTKGSNLKKFHIQTEFFMDAHNPDEDVHVNWSFLKKMKRLQDFRCAFHREILQEVKEYSSGGKLLSLIPAATAVNMKKIDLRGMENFWCNVDDGTEVSMERRIGIMKGFRNVTELKLTMCRKAVNDELMQCIIMEFKQLRVLEISHAKELTNFGITGVRRNFIQSGVSLRQLTGLIHLKIRVCKYITYQGIADAVALPYLRTFEFKKMTGLGASRHFLVKLLGQNPSLESFSFNLSLLEDTAAMMEDLRQLSGRFRNLGHWRDQTADPSDIYYYSSSDDDTDDNDSL